MPVTNQLNLKRPYVTKLATQMDKLCGQSGRTEIIAESEAYAKVSYKNCCEIQIIL